MTSIASGPPGIEVVHAWNAAFRINTPQSEGFPRIKVDKITGMNSLPEFDDNREPNVGRSGEYLLPSYTRGKTLVYTGRIQAPDLDSLKVKATAMRGAFRHRIEGGMRLLGAQEWVFYARVMQLEADDEFTQYLPGAPLERCWELPFTLGLRMTNGKYIAYPDQATGGAANGATHDFTNLGNSGAFPVFTLPVGLGSTPTLENTTTNLTLKFEAMPHAGTLTVDFSTQTATLDGLDVSGLVSLPDSDWWDDDNEGVQPGVNTVYVSGISGPWTMSFYHTSE